MARAGFCSECNANVWLNEDGSCANGHPADCVSCMYETAPRRITSGGKMPGLAQMLQEKCQAATSAVVQGGHAVGEELEHGAQVVAPAAQQGRLALVHGAQLVVEGVQQGAQAVGPAAQQGGQALAHGAQVVGRGVQRGAEIVKAHPKEAAIIAGAAVVAAGALPFVPWSVPAALGVVSAATAGAKATENALSNCAPVERPDEETQPG